MARTPAPSRARSGGDSPSSLNIHDELWRFDVAGYYGDVERLLSSVDPPRENGDPFEEDISEAQQARRFNGRKFVSHFHQGILEHECLYKVILFRRFVPKVGLNGAGVFQFWGVRAVRSRMGDGPWSDWNVGPHQHHTVDPGNFRSWKRR